MESARMNPKNPQGDYLLRPTYDLLAYLLRLTYLLLFLPFLHNFRAFIHSAYKSDIVFTDFDVRNFSMSGFLWPHRVLAC